MIEKRWFFFAACGLYELQHFSWVFILPPTHPTWKESKLVTHTFASSLVNHDLFLQCIVTHITQLDPPGRCSHLPLTTGFKQAVLSSRSIPRLSVFKTIFCGVSGSLSLKIYIQLHTVRAWKLALQLWRHVMYTWPRQGSNNTPFPSKFIFPKHRSFIWNQYFNGLKDWRDHMPLPNWITKRLNRKLASRVSTSCVTAGHCARERRVCFERGPLWSLPDLPDISRTRSAGSHMAFVASGCPTSDSSPGHTCCNQHCPAGRWHQAEAARLVHLTAISQKFCARKKQTNNPMI